MANIKSALKRIEVTERNAMRNKARKTEIKTLIKKFNAQLDKGAIDEARESLKAIDKKLKQASQKNILHKNNVARKVGQLQLKLNAKNK
ncbi:MAG: 30S ribosomal protein S20 [Tissierellia bacterium]|nr:30S ribosomal protein S20 [Tissierellia bacterium]